MSSRGCWVKAEFLRSGYLSLAGIVLWGCAPTTPISTRSVLANPAYANAQLDRRVLQVFPMRDVHILNPSDLAKAFPEYAQEIEQDPGRLFAHLLGGPMAKHADRSLPGPLLGFSFDSAQFRDTIVTDSSGSTVHRTPFSYPKAEALRSSGLNPDLGLQWEHVWVRRSKRGDGPTKKVWVLVFNPMTNAYGMSYQKITVGRSLEFKGNFTLWDYKADALVACGEVYSYSPLGFSVVQETWSRGFDGWAREVIAAVPALSKAAVVVSNPGTRGRR